MPSNRRTVLAFGLAAAAAAAVGRPAAALEADAARTHVRGAVDRVIALASRPGAPESKADDLARIFRDTAAMPQIARFAAGLAWRDMSEDQQDRFVDAFVHYLSVVYARRFQDYSGQTVDLGRVEDAGRRGLRVLSTVSQPNDQPIAVEWVVTDRPGRVVISDIVIEGVSLVVTQREEIGGMLSSRGGDLERLISDLAAT